MNKGITHDKKKIALFVIVVVLVLVLVCSEIITLVKFRQVRREYVQTRIEFELERRRSAELKSKTEFITDRVVECQESVGRIRELQNEDATTIRECIQLIREIRKEVEVLENVLDSINVSGSNVYNNNGGSDK